jgi:hypothetical protein
MNDNLARFSTSDTRLKSSKKYDAKTKILKLRQLKFRHCEGYYSQHMMLALGRVALPKWTAKTA